MHMKTRLTALASRSATPWRPDRVVALDIARMIALLGMFSEHLLMGNAPEAVLAVVTGFPSTMFAVLGGASAAVSTRTLIRAGRPAAACLSVAVRGLLIATIGLILGAVPLVIVMVLSYYGFALIALACVLRLPTWALGCLAAALSLAGPHLILWARATGAAGAIASPSFASPLEFLQTIVFTGFYPAITWFTYMLIGLCAGRAVISGRARIHVAAALFIPGLLMFIAGFISDILSRAAVIDTLVADGTSAQTAHKLVENGYGTPLGSGWLALLSGAPHTGTTADIMRTAGMALVVFGALLMAIPRDSAKLPLPGKIIARAGSAPLTIYILHFFGFYALLLIAILADSSGVWVFGPVGIAIHTLAALGVGTYLLLTDRRGPLETLISRIVRGAVDRFCPAKPAEPRTLETM